MRLLLIEQGASFKWPDLNVKVGQNRCKVQVDVWRKIPNRSPILEAWIGRIRSMNVESLAQPLLIVPNKWRAASPKFDRIISALDNRQRMLNDLFDDANSA